MLGLAGYPGMPGERGTIIFEGSIQKLVPGEKGPKGFPGREGDMGSMGYLCAFLLN